jgi:hypothetical protein
MAVTAVMILISPSIGPAALDLLVAAAEGLITTPPPEAEADVDAETAPDALEAATVPLGTGEEVGVLVSLRRLANEGNVTGGLPARQIPSAMV